MSISTDKRIPTRGEIDGYVRLYAEGRSLEEIGGMYRRGHSTVSRYLRRRGVAIRSPYAKKATPERVADWRAKRAAGARLADLVAESGVSQTVIWGAVADVHCPLPLRERGGR